MKVNRISNIIFKDNNIRENEFIGENDSQNAILMLRDPIASIKFEKNREMAQNADAISTSPIKALGYKLYRTFSILKDTDYVQDSAQEKHLNILA